MDKEHSPFGPNGSMSSSQTADLGLATPEDYDESLRAKRRAERTDPRERAWYYIDPEVQAAFVSHTSKRALSCQS